MTKKKDDQEKTVDKKVLLKTLTDPKFIEKLTGRIALHYTLGTIREDHPSKEEEKKMFDIIEALKNNPQILQTWIKQNENIEQNEVITEDIAPKEVFTAAQSMLSIAKKEYRKEIATALEEYPNSKVTLSTNADFLWNVILAALLLAPPREYIEELAEKLEISPDKLADIGQRAKEKEKEEYLPGLAPSQNKHIAKTLDIIRQQKIVYNLITKRGTSKVDRKAGYILNTRDNEITFALDIRGSDPIDKSKDVIRVKWNAPYNEKGEQLRVTPFDQDIETVISNFYDEGHPAVTTEQIYYAMTGQSASTGYPNKQILQAIEQSIEKLNTIPVSIRRIKNGSTREDENGNIIVEGGTETIIAEYGTILDTAKTGYVEIQGKHRLAWISSRKGHLYNTEKMLGRLISTKRETLNISTSGISFTELSLTLRRFCLMEITRFTTTHNYTIKDNKFLLDSMYLYEADPELVEITPDMKRKLKTGATAGEQAKIRNAKKRRRDLLQKLLQHFKVTGDIIDWDFCNGNKKLTYTRAKDDPNKRIYKETADSVYIQVKKTDRAINAISTIERRIETAERNSRRAKKNNQE